MPKFGDVHFGNVYFGDSAAPRGWFKRSLGNIPLGLRVRRQIGKQVIFRVRRGNGYYGAVAGMEYQDKYKYFVPDSINNSESDGVRSLLSQAVSNWKIILTDEQKKDYNTRAKRFKYMSGFNLYIREYIKANL